MTERLEVCDQCGEVAVCVGVGPVLHYPGGGCAVDEVLSFCLACVKAGSKEEYYERRAARLAGDE
jgi:hypothetical protein